MSALLEMEEAVSDISSTASPQENTDVFKRKIISRQYKCLIIIFISSMSFIMLLWFTLLAHFFSVIMGKMEIDFNDVKEYFQLIKNTSN